MAGDWMKVELELPQKPEVWQLAATLQIDPDAVVGKLIKVWAWFDKHTEDGNAFGVTFALLDSIAGVTGFGEAMTFVGWLEQKDRTLCLPKFDRHNGKTAKNRALTAKRVAECKSKSNAEGNGASVTGALPREEKRREEKEDTSAAIELIPLEDGSDFPVTESLAAEFRSAYPRIDVPAQLKKARAWCIANPGNRKTRRGVTKFLNSWLARANDSAPSPAPVTPIRRRQEL